MRLKRETMQNGVAENNLADKLAAALRARDAAAVDSLLRQGAPVDSWNIDGHAPLFLAVESKRPVLVQMVATRTGNIDVQDSCDFTPFTQAVRLNLPEIAHILLDHGASPFPSGRGAEYPLDWAVSGNQYGLIKRMLASWPDRHYKEAPLLLYAAEHADEELAKACIDAGAGINRGERKNGHTALHVAAKKGNISFIRLLIGAGADEHATDVRGQTAMDWARNAGHEKVIARAIMERDMHRAALAMVEGTQDDLIVRPPVQLKRSPGLKNPKI
jgi:ankyrin repeat protein